MDDKIQTYSIEEMKGFLSQFGFDRNKGFDTPLHFNPRMGEISGDQKGYNPKLRASELALLTIKEDGSAPRNYQSVSDARQFFVPLFIGSYSSNEEILVVSDLADDETMHLLHPARLKLNHIIGYECLRKFD